MENYTMITPPHLYRQISIPQPFQTTTQIDGHALTFGGDIRVGDLTGDGAFDFLVYRCDTQSELKPTFLGAFTTDGNILWQVGSGGKQPLRPGSVTLYDINNDGSDEVICFFHKPNGQTPKESLNDIIFQIRSGQTGEVILEKSHPAIQARSGWGPNWCHQRLFIANLRGTDFPQDIIIKLGDTVVAFDDNLELLWQYTIQWNEYSKCSAYIPSVGDLTGDGRDEINGGYYILNPDGTPRWEKQLAPNMDSVAIVPWDDGTMRAICSGGGHILDKDGNARLALGKETVPHGQEVRVGNFLPNHPSPQMVIRHEGHNPPVIIVDNNGQIVSHFSLNSSPNETGMEVVHWNGDSEPDLIYNGGQLFDGNRNSLPLPDLPPPVGPKRMGWYHCIPGNFCGDTREDILLYNPWAPDIYIYTSEPLDESAYRGYSATARQYNARLMD